MAQDGTLIFDGYDFIKNKTSHSHNKIYWRCKVFGKKGCKVTVVTSTADDGRQIVKRASEKAIHVHNVDDSKINEEMDKEMNKEIDNGQYTN